jgi:hypothetical protein
MSLYRQVGGRGARGLVGALLAGVLLGGLAGFLIGHNSADEPSAAELIGNARAELRPVGDALELVPIEYRGAVRGGRVVAETEYQAAREAISRAEDTLAAAGEDMRAIDPTGYAAATAAVARLAKAVDTIEPPTRVEALARTAGEKVGVLSGGSK